ncbi:toll/interleukin-1 receptor domain-containing protein, partial [Pirellulales bacterium]|nr:toll/interleukin-1 receptor domain-containing protein [Pirellulales bacterium]
MPKVFVSHASQDRLLVEREIVGFLNERGIETWYSTDAIRVGEHWERRILDGLKGCDSFIVVMSPDSARSEWVKDEVAWAFGTMPNRIIPVLIRDCNPLDFHLRMSRLQHVDFRHDIRKGKVELLANWGITDADDFAHVLDGGDRAQIRAWIWEHRTALEPLIRDVYSPEVGCASVDVNKFHADFAGVSSASVTSLVVCSLGSPKLTEVDELRSKTESFARLIDYCSKNQSAVLEHLLTKSEQQLGTESLLRIMHDPIYGRQEWRVTGRY